MTEPATPAVHCRQLSKTYASDGAPTPALRALDVDIHPGELTVLAGPSGCGKTTLLSIMSALLERDDGICEVFGRDLNGATEVERAHFRNHVLGFVFQSFNLLPALTATANVAVPLLIQGRPRDEAEARAARMLETVGLASRKDALPTRMSGGQQQRVAIARALVHGPRLVVCDEPTSALDHATGLEMMRLLRSAALAPERAVLVVTHDPRVFPFADRLLHMDDGRIIGDERQTVLEVE
ncbi:MAG: ABC transporter ATP-binding protein [Lysobacter sp.]|nr:MAG: ABC transporter ATP-binding protein [Lysobacter sp.]